MATFRHAGDLGDIIYSLPVVKHFGGGEFLIEPAPYTRVFLTRDKWCGIDLLLSQQDYITGVRGFRIGEYATFNLNDFRSAMNEMMRQKRYMDKSLCDWMLETHKVPLSARNVPWLNVEPTRVAEVVINRSGAGRPHNSCYHNWKFPWHRVWSKYVGQAVFIGNKAEHEMFCDTCGDIAYYPTANLLEAARVIAGSELFIGNQSVCHAIAEGLKKRIILEVWPQGPNCLFFRDNVTHFWEGNLNLPDL